MKTVSAASLLKRINRRLADTTERVQKSRSIGARRDFGTYYRVDLNFTGDEHEIMHNRKGEPLFAIVEHNVNLVALARKLGALKEGERA